MEPVALSFDYQRLDTETRFMVEAARDRIKTLQRKTSEAIVEIGRCLIQAKNDLPHGQFGPWLESEFGWTDRTAQRFMAVTEAFQNRQIVGIQPSALYALASGSVPDEVREDFIERAEQGETVTHQAVQEAIRDAKQAAPERPTASNPDPEGRVEKAPEPAPSPGPTTESEPEPEPEQAPSAEPEPEPASVPVAMAPKSSRPAEDDTLAWVNSLPKERVAAWAGSVREAQMPHHVREVLASVTLKLLDAAKELDTVPEEELRKRRHEPDIHERIESITVYAMGIFLQVKDAASEQAGNPQAQIRRVV